MYYNFEVAKNATSIFMKIFIKLKPGAKENRVERINEKSFVISVKDPPINGKANEAMIRLLANYFGTTKTSVKIISGFTSRQKIVDVG